MENTETLDLPNTDLKIDTTTAKYLSTIAGWSKFLSILGFVISGIVIVAGIILAAYLGGSRGGAFFGYFVAVIIYSAVIFLPSRWLYLFAVKATASIDHNESDLLREGLRNLKNFFVFQSVMTLIFIGLYLILMMTVGFRGF